MRTALLSTFVSLIVVALACQEAEESVVILSREDLESQLRARALLSGDLPAGLSLQEERFTSNEDLANEADDPEQELERLNRSGRLLGYEAIYSTPTFPLGATPGEIGTLIVELAVYKTSDAAQLEFESAAAGVPEALVQTVENGQPAELAEIAFPKFGAESVALRGSWTDANIGVKFFMSLVVIRVGQYIAGVAVFATDEPPSLSDLQLLATKIAERLESR